MDIRFEQAAYINSEKDKISLYEKRINEITRQFTKSPYLQMHAWDLFMKILELNIPYHDHDYSEYLMRKSEEVFREFEDLQNNEKLQNLKTMIIETIQKLNKLEIY